MFIYISILLATFTETVVNEFSFPLLGIPTTISKNLQEHDSTYILRDKEGAGALLTFKDKNKSDEWSASFKFNVPSLKFSERAFITFWYTGQSLEAGEFYGQHGTFEGIMFGLELSHNSSEIILCLNDGRDYQNYEELAMREYLKIGNLYGVVTFKLVYTKKNMKLEIYSNDTLVYDSLRFYDTSVLHFVGSDKLFSVTTKYHNVSFGSHFILRDFKLYNRAEHEDYDPRAIESKTKHMVDEEIEHSISNLEFFLGYLKYVIGKPTGTTITGALIQLNEEIVKEKAKIDELKDVFDPKNVKLSGITQKIVEMDIQLQNMIRVMNELKYFLLDFEKTHDKNTNWIIFVVVALLVGLMVYSLVPERKIKKN